MKKMISMPAKHAAILFGNILESEKRTCYPDEPRKSKLSIAWDNFRWVLQFGCANPYYFLLGLDRRHTAGREQKMISGARAKKVRNQKMASFYLDYMTYLGATQDKFLAASYMDRLGFPVPRTLALIHGLMVLLPDSGRRLPLDEWLSDPGALPADCICKPVADGKGRGVFHLEIRNNRFIVQGAEIDAFRLKEMFSKTRYLIQERLAQHPSMVRLNPYSVNTIRLVTCYDAADPVPFSAAVRVGRKGRITDNWHTGGMVIRLDMEQGRLTGDGFTLPEHGGKRYPMHPDTGVIFNGYEIPFAQEAVKLATRLHRYFYYAHSIGWDIAITSGGPVVIEANQTWDTYVHAVVEEDFMEKFRRYFCS